jgi:hypothetical protein
MWLNRTVMAGLDVVTVHLSPELCLIGDRAGARLPSRTGVVRFIPIGS